MLISSLRKVRACTHTLGMIGRVRERGGKTRRTMGVEGLSRAPRGAPYGVSQEGEGE